MHRLRIMPIEGSSGLILPNEILSQLGVGLDDHLYLVDIPGGFMITNSDPEHERQVDSAEKAMSKYATTLRDLSK